MNKQLDPNILIKQSNLRQWIEDLPYANPAGVAEQIHFALEQLNLYTKPLPNRWQLLELFLRPFETILNTYQEIILNQRDSNLKSSDKLLMEKTEKITKILASGFKRCIQDDVLANKGKLPEHAKLVIFQAMRCLNLARLFDFLYYRTASPRSWREMGNLYRLGRKMGILHEPVAIPASSMLSESTIEREFLRGILLSLADPSRLSRDNIWRVYLYLDIWVPQAKIIEHNAARPADDNFLVDLRKADVVIPFSPDKIPDEIKYSLVLDTSLLIILVEEQISSLQPDPDRSIQGIPMLKGEQAEKLLQYMHQNWHGRPERRFIRTKQQDRLVAVRGLEAVCHFLEQGRKSETKKNVAELIQRTELGVDTAKAWASGSSNQSYDTFTWYQLNISDGGMAILADTSFLNKSHIGQLILAKSQTQQDGPAWRLGVIRRAKQKNKISMELGIEFLRGKVTAIE
jgi:hypothetical protein